jgi:hypothetical protein
MDGTSEVVEEPVEATHVTITLGSKEITANSQYDDYVYRNEGVPFSSCCLYEFVQRFKKVAKRKIDRIRIDDTLAEPEPGHAHSPSGDFMLDHPNFLTHRLSQTTVEAVPVILGPTIPHPDKGPTSREDWAQAMLILFKPWRSPADLKPPNESWSDAYDRFGPSPELFKTSLFYMSARMHAIRTCRLEIIPHSLLVRMEPPWRRLTG